MDNNTFFIQCLGISQDPKTCEYIMIMEFADCGSLSTYLNTSIKWDDRVKALLYLSKGLDHLHNSNLTHQDFHPGNLVFNIRNILLITDFGLCKPVNQSLQSNNIYGVMPYVAPEVLRGKPYTKAADIYSFGMIMYFVATGKQPFADCAHNQELVLNICNGIRPEVKEPEAPKCYINLMKKCWDSNPDNRPDVAEIKRLIGSFCSNFKQFKEADDYRKANPLSIENTQLITHSQAHYTSRLLNSYTKNLPKYDNINNNSVEIIDFTE